MDKTNEFYETLYAALMDLEIYAFEFTAEDTVCLIDTEDAEIKEIEYMLKELNKREGAKFQYVIVDEETTAIYKGQS